MTEPTPTPHALTVLRSGATWLGECACEKFPARRYVSPTGLCLEFGRHLVETRGK